MIRCQILWLVGQTDTKAHYLKTPLSQRSQALQSLNFPPAESDCEHKPSLAIAGHKLQYNSACKLPHIRSHNLLAYCIQRIRSDSLTPQLGQGSVEFSPKDSDSHLLSGAPSHPPADSQMRIAHRDTGPGEGRATRTCSQVVLSQKGHKTMARFIANMCTVFYPISQEVYVGVM